jgi:hypothetical protein
MDEMRLEAHARLLRDVIDVYEVLVDPVWVLFLVRQRQMSCRLGGVLCAISAC